MDDVRHIQDDAALRVVLGLKIIPDACTLGAWLVRMGGNESRKGMREVNKVVLKSALHQCKGVTLDIDATEIVSHKTDAKWTYNKHKGIMPMVGHVAQTGQVVACNSRLGNVAPARDNLAFIQQCE